MSDLEQRHDWNTGANVGLNDLTVRCRNCHKPLIPNTSDYPDWQSIDWREHWKNQPCVPNYFVHIAELETQLAERETDLERESGRANDNALKIMRLVTRNSALQAQLAEARSEIERRPAPDFFREILKQRNEAEYRLAEANTELQKANDEIREWKRHR